MKQNKSVNRYLKLLLASSVIAFIGIFLSKVFSYLHRIIVARYFGPEEYGLFLLAFVILGTIGAFASLGLQEGLLRFIPRQRVKNDKERIRYLLLLSSRVTICTGTIAGVVLFIFSETIAQSIFSNIALTPYLRVFSILIPLTLLNNILLATIKSFEKIAIYSFIYNFSQNFVKVVALVALIFLGVTQGAIIWSQVITILWIFFISYYFARKLSPRIFLGVSKLAPNDRDVLRRSLISYSWPIMFYSILGSILYWVDSFSIGYFIGVKEVGFYNVAVPTAALLTFAPEIFMQLFFPLINREYSKGNIKVIRELSKQVSKWIFMVNLPLFLLMLIFPGTIINLLFGSQYLSAVNSLRILAIGSFIFSMFVISTNLLNMAGKSKVILVNTIVIGVVDLVLNIIFVPLYGINGAALTTMVSFILLGSLLYLETKSYVSIVPFRRKMMRICLVTTIPLILLLFLRSILPITLLTVILLGLMFCSVYLILIFATKCLDENDLAILNGIKNKINKIKIK